jgi:hypothetical protein
MSATRLDLVCAPIVFLNASGARIGGPAVADLYGQVLGGGSACVEKYWDAQDFSEENQGLCDGDGMACASADNVGCQKTVQKFCEADNKLEIITHTASVSTLLSRDNFIQYTPLAHPNLWLDSKSNPFTEDPTILNTKESTEHEQETDAWIARSL